MVENNTSLLIVVLMSMLAIFGCGNGSAVPPEERVWQLPAPNAELDPPDKVYQARVYQALQNHQAKFQFATEPLAREMWQYPGTLAEFDHWGADLAERILAGETPDAKAMKSYADAVKYLKDRTDNYLNYAGKSFGSRNDYYIVHLERIAKDANALFERADTLLDEKRRGELKNAFAPWLTENVLAAQEDVRRAVLENIGEMARKHRLSGKNRKTEYLSNDPEIRSALDERKIAYDQALMPVLQAFTAQYRSDRMTRLQPFFPPDAFPEEALRKAAADWEGWRLRDIGPLVVVQPSGNNMIEVAMDDLLMESDTGHVAKAPTRLVMFKNEQGRYMVAHLGGIDSAMEARLIFDELLEERMKKFYYEKTLNRYLQGGS